LPPNAQTVFFSYSRDDSEFAIRLAEDLKAAGAHVWLDQSDIVPGQQWDRAARDALNNAPRMLVILSPSSAGSTQVGDEVTFALEEHKTVIPILYRDCKIPFRLLPFQNVDFRTDYARGLNVLLEILDVERPEITAPCATSATLVDSRSEVLDAVESQRATDLARLEERGHATEQARLERERKQAAEQAHPEQERPRATEQVQLTKEDRKCPSSLPQLPIEPDKAPTDWSARQPGWFKRNRKWMFLLLFVATPIMVLLIVFAALGTSEASRLALERARLNPDVVQRLGVPLKRGWLTLGKIKESGSGGRADLEIPVSAPKGKGRLYVLATKSAGVWYFETLKLKIDGQDTPIELLPALPEGMNPNLGSLYRRAEAGDSGAMVGLGFAYGNGQGVSTDYQEAVRWYRKAAEAGRPYGMFDLGVCYETGRGVEKDYQQALTWYRKAAQVGNAEAMTNLGVMYQRGDGVEKDFQQAISWFRKGAQAGNANGLMNLGAMYEQGEGVAKDDQQAISWYRKAAQAGNAKAMMNLGVRYEHGEGVEKDFQQAISWFRRAADQGNADGLNNVAWIYATSSDPTLRNPGAAVEYALKAVSAGKKNPDPDHLDTLAEAYYANRQYQDAIKTEQRAIALAPQEKKVQFQKNLERYQRALHESK
jgi:TPR repeat protein